MVEERPMSKHFRQQKPGSDYLRHHLYCPSDRTAHNATNAFVAVVIALSVSAVLGALSRFGLACLQLVNVRILLPPILLGYRYAGFSGARIRDLALFYHIHERAGSCYA